MDMCVRIYCFNYGGGEEARKRECQNLLSQSVVDDTLRADIATYVIALEITDLHTSD